MKKLACAFSVLASLCLGACSTTESLGTQLSGVLDTLSSPQATQAANNVGKVVTAVACGVAAASNTAGSVDTQVGGSTQSQQIIQTIYVASTATCKLIGGIVQGTATVPVAAVTPVVQ